MDSLFYLILLNSVISAMTSITPTMKVDLRGMIR